MLEKVYQNIFGKGGNCASAVHATILGIKLDQVPYYNDGLADMDIPQDEIDFIFNQRIEKFLNDNYNCHESWYHYDDPNIQSYLKEYPDRPYQVVGKSPRDYMHVVIYMNGELWHDPHPEGGGVEETYVVLIVRNENEIQ